MKTLLKVLAMTTLSVSSSFALAECAGFNCSRVLVQRILIYPDGSSASIRTSGDESQLDCDARAGYIQMDPNLPKFDAMYSLLLTAHTTQSPVTIRTSGTGDICSVVYVVSDK